MSDENKLVDISVDDNKLKLGVDPNKDGENVVDLELDLGEGLQEVMARDVPAEGVKVVDFKINGTKLELVLDTDKDGEHLLKLSADLGEAFDEVQDAIAKKSAGE